MLVREKFGDRNNFLLRFNPSAQIEAAKNSDWAFFGDSPSLVVLRKTYGENTAKMWLLPQILDLVVYCNSRGTLQQPQAEFLADAIAQEYFYLKVSELLLFFYRFKLGRYGQFYGVVDPMRVTMALEEFCKERRAAIAKRENEELQAERDRWAEDAITPKEYCRRHGLPEMSSMAEIIAFKAREEENVNPPSN